MFLVVFLSVACAGGNLKPAAGEPLTGEDWYRFRAGQLSISQQAAVERDRQLSEEEPPELPENEAFRRQTALLYERQCAACHGSDGDPGDFNIGRFAPREFGTMGMSMGFTFGGDKMRAGIYRVIRDGKKRGETVTMPAFGDRLAREQIWALVRYIENL